jgi:hypothetical protein
MSHDRYIVTQFCDDIRMEVGNKYSLIGCYGDELIVENIPGTLPKFCVQTRAITPTGRLFSKLVFRAYLNDEMLGELVLSETQLAEGRAMLASRPGSERLSIMAMMVFSPLNIAAPGQMRIEAETDDGTLSGNRIFIRRRDQPDSLTLANGSTSKTH